ncbi:putative integrase [Bacillus phage vB_BhaS-171]|uniref:integrase n=1 Tax=Bacillus phage vB_BhaS-171 TaxID=1775140 RepID=UPI000744AD75|nr:integrase [Bacillus phage vB_BhaS-171]ALY08091.1 putative integrase [Bacillus phage vB_BhaS-171]
MAYFRKKETGWSFTIDVGRDPLTGKRKQLTRSGFKKKAEAAEEAARLKKEFKTKQVTSITFEKLYDLWNQSAEVKDSTMSQRDYIVKAHILPYFNKKKVEKVKPLDVQNFIQWLKDKGLKQNSIVNVRGFLVAILNKAVDLELIEKNPALNIKVKKEKSKKAAWKVDEAKEFLEYCQDNSLYWLAYYFALYCGMRIGEICALKWDDLREDSVFIERTAAQINGKWITQTPKTEGSYREVPLNDTLKEKIAIWEQSKKDDWLFSGKEQFIIPNTIRKDFYRLTGETDLPKINFHDLRATHITMLLDAGVPVHIVAKRVGHSDISMTLNVYSRVHDDQLRGSSTKIEEILKNVVD